MWRKIIAIGAVGLAGIVVLACSGAAAGETKDPEPTTTARSEQPASEGGLQPGAGGGVSDSSLANGKLPQKPTLSTDPAVSGAIQLAPNRAAGMPADASDPALSTDPAVSGLSLLDPNHPAYTGPTDAPAYANDLPLPVNPPVRDLPQTDPYDPTQPTKPNSIRPSPPAVIDGGATGDPGTPPELRKPIDRITGKPLDPDGSVSSPPNPGVNVPAPAPSGPTQPGLVPLPAGVTRVPAPIDDADIVVRESFPPQYAVEIMAGLPGGCAKQAGYAVERSGMTFKVSVYNAMPSSPMICTAIYGMYRVSVTLDNITAGVTYTVIVNDKTLTFTAQ